MYNIVFNDYLEHHGILGQKWGRRRYQNPDGTLTEEGILRYYKKGELTRKGKERYAESMRLNPELQKESARIKTEITNSEKYSDAKKEVESLYAKRDQLIKEGKNKEAAEVGKMAMTLNYFKVGPAIGEDVTKRMIHLHGSEVLSGKKIANLESKITKNRMMDLETKMEFLEVEDFEPFYKSNRLDEYHGVLSGNNADKYKQFESEYKKLERKYERLNAR